MVEYILSFDTAITHIGVSLIKISDGGKLDIPYMGIWNINARKTCEFVLRTGKNKGKMCGQFAVKQTTTKEETTEEGTTEGIGKFYCKTHWDGTPFVKIKEMNLKENAVACARILHAKVLREYESRISKITPIIDYAIIENQEKSRDDVRAIENFITYECVSTFQCKNVFITHAQDKTKLCIPKIVELSTMTVDKIVKENIRGKILKRIMYDVGKQCTTDICDCMLKECMHPIMYEKYINMTRRHDMADSICASIIFYVGGTYGTLCKYSKEIGTFLKEKCNITVNSKPIYRIMREQISEKRKGTTKETTERKGTTKRKRTTKRKESTKKGTTKSK